MLRRKLVSDHLPSQDDRRHLAIARIEAYGGLFMSGRLVRYHVTQLHESAYDVGALDRQSNTMFLAWQHLQQEMDRPTSKRTMRALCRVFRERGVPLEGLNLFSVTDAMNPFAQLRTMEHDIPLSELLRMSHGDVWLRFRDKRLATDLNDTLGAHGLHLGMTPAELHGWGILS